MKRFIFMMVFVLAAFGAAGTCIFYFWRTSVRLEAENRALKDRYQAACAECDQVRENHQKAITAKDEEIKTLSESKDALARNLLGAVKSCDKLQAKIRQLTDEKSSLEKTLALERRLAREKAKEDAALTAAREEAERKALDRSELTDLIKLTDQAPRKEPGI